MKKKAILYKLFYKVRNFNLKGWLFFAYYKTLGLEAIGYVRLADCRITWPHAIKFGKNIVLEQNIYFKHDGPYSAEKSIIIGDHVFIGAGCEFNIRKKITIANNVLIASGCKFVDHDHGIAKNQLIKTQVGPEAEITIEEDVWIGANVVVLKGVTIGKGAVVAASAVVNKSIRPYEIWGGIPAKKLSERK